MARATSGLRRIIENLPIGDRLSAIVLAVAALLLAALSASGGINQAYSALIAATLAGFAIAMLFRQIAPPRKVELESESAELSGGNARLQRTIAELEAAKLQAEAVSKAKSEFLASMSHELRTPLNAIIGFSDLMQSEVLGPLGNPTYREYAADINFSGSHLLDIINDILDVVRHEAGRMELKEEFVEVEEVISEALRLMAPPAQQGRVHLVWRAPAEALPPFYCDRVRLRQILLNLLSNAVKFTGPGGTVEIAAELGDGLQLTVKDSGIGIKEEDIARIMTPFGQVASVYSRNHQGTGLGLPLTKALVERHDGRLSLRSAPNIGTTVRLSFPPERLARDRSAAHIRLGG